MVCSYVGDHRLTWATAWSWLKGEAWDSRHDSRQQKLQEVRVLSTPTLMIQGESDFCDAPSESEGLEAYFTGRYQRALLDGIGHFPHREAPDEVAEAVNRHLQATAV